MTRGLQPIYDRVPNKVTDGGLCRRGCLVGAALKGGGIVKFSKAKKKMKVRCTPSCPERFWFTGTRRICRLTPRKESGRGSSQIDVDGVLHWFYPRELEPAGEEGDAK